MFWDFQRKFRTFMKIYNYQQSQKTTKTNLTNKKYKLKIEQLYTSTSPDNTGTIILSQPWQKRQILLLTSYTQRKGDIIACGLLLFYFSQKRCKLGTIVQNWQFWRKNQNFYHGPFVKFLTFLEQPCLVNTLILVSRCLLSSKNQVP